METIHNYLGVELSIEIIAQILHELGCEVTTTQQHDNTITLSVNPPTFRPDLTIPADIVEEIARIYGYHNLPSVIMPTPIPRTKPINATFKLEKKLKTFLVNIGWQELYTYSMVSQELAVESGYTIDEHLKIQNPLTDDRVYLRNSLIPSLNEVIDQHPMEKNLAVFEIANVYIKQPSGLPSERQMLSMVSSKPFRAVKGDVEAILDQLFIKKWKVRLSNLDLPYIAQSAVLYGEIDGEEHEIGTIVTMKNGRTAVTLDIDTLNRFAHTHPTYHPTPSTAQIVEDLTFTLPEKTAVGEVIESIKSESAQITQVELKDMYHTNFTFALTYQDPSSNLTSQDIEPIRKRIVQRLKTKCSADLVGKV